MRSKAMQTSFLARDLKWSLCSFAQQVTENSSQFEGTTAGAEIDPCAAVRELGNCCRVTTCLPSADQINTACKPGSNREPIPLELRRHLVHTANQSLRGLLRVQRFTSKGADLEVKCPDYGEGTPCLTEGSRAHTKRRTEEYRGVPRGPRTTSEPEKQTLKTQTLKHLRQTLKTHHELWNISECFKVCHNFQSLSQ